MQAGIGIQQVNTFEDCRPSRKTKEFIIKPIPLEVVERTWKKISKMPLGESPKLINLMRKQQSVVLAYLLAAGHKTLNQDEQELLLYMGIVVWQIMLQGSNPLIKATKSALDEAEKANIKMLEYLEGEPEADFIETSKKIISNYPQPEILRYVAEALTEETEEDSVITDEGKGIIMVYLKTVIDCFNR